MNHAPQQRAEPPRPSLATTLCPTRTLRPLAFGLLLLASPAALEAQSLAFTLDDGPRLVATPMLTPEQRNAALIRQLRQHQVQALFFVTTGNGANRPEGLAQLKALSASGQLLANHTVSHPDSNAAGTTLEAFEAEVLGCDQVIATLPGYRKFLRFPFLCEGASAEKRDGIRAFLKAKGWRIVSPDVAFADPAYAVAPMLQRLDGSVLETSAQALGIPLAPFFQGITSERRVGELAAAL